MPRLEERSDGLYYVRHYYRQHATWQIDDNGVLFLRERGFCPGDMFPTKVFMELWTRGMVYTGTVPAQIGQWRPRALSRDDLALRERATALYTALFQHKTEDAYTFLLPRVRASKTLDQFKAQLSDRFAVLTSWLIRSADSLPCRCENTPEVTLSGFVIVDLEIQDESGAHHKLYAQQDLWLRWDGMWYLLEGCGPAKPPSLAADRVHF